MDLNERCLYVISTPSGYWKIGIAKEPQNRLRSLQTGNPEQLTLYTEIGTLELDPLSIEREIHNNLAPFRTTGEWFKATQKQILTGIRRAFSRYRAPAVYARYIRRFGGRLERTCGQPDEPPQYIKVDGYFDRTAYQRDLMRKRRAAMREAGEATKPDPSAGDRS